MLNFDSPFKLPLLFCNKVLELYSKGPDNMLTDKIERKKGKVLSGGEK